MTKQVTRKPSTMLAFKRGMSWGRKGVFRGSLCVEQSEECIVEFVQNVVDFALEGNLTEELLCQTAGIIVGFVLSYPEVFTTLAGGN